MRSLGLCLSALMLAPATVWGESLQSVDTVVVIYMENHSFDNVFGLFPGADGIANAQTHAALQVDANGRPLAVLPQPRNTGKGAPDPRFPNNLANAPFPMESYVPGNFKTGDLVHRFYTNQLQIDGGKNDKFAIFSDAGGLTMGYYDGRTAQVWKWAQRFTLADHFFMGAFGGSFLNHQFMICACAPVFPNAPEDMKAILGPSGDVIKDGAVTPDGYAVNTVLPTYQPHEARYDTPQGKAHLLPPQDAPTIGDRLSAKGVSRAWYSGGWNKAISGNADAYFQFHHQPFAYYRAYGDGTAARAEHLKDGADFLSAIDQGALPHVAFYKPIGDLNQHPGYADLVSGDLHVQFLLDKLEHSPQWPHMVVIVTWDENGGFYDHVAPPKGDRWGPGTRIPTLIISPFAKTGVVDHTVYDTASILAFIEKRWNLTPLGSRDANANPLSGAFTFKQ